MSFCRASAPLRVGATSVAPHMDNRPEDDIRSRVFPGTTNLASLLTVPDALAFQAKLGGVARKEARLKLLRNYWVERVRSPKVEILTPDELGSFASVTSFRIKGVAPAAIQRTLLEHHRILTVARTGIANGDAVRVTPALYNTEDDLDRLARASGDCRGRDLTATCNIENSNTPS